MATYQSDPHRHTAPAASPQNATQPGALDKAGLGQVPQPVAAQTSETMAELTPGQLQYQQMLQKTAPILQAAALTDQPAVADCQRKTDGSCSLSNCPCELTQKGGQSA